MKQLKIKAAVTGLTLGASLLAGVAAPDTAFAQKKGVQRVTVTIDGSGYKPATVNVRAGQPVQLTFVSKGDSCANTVSIPDLKKTLSLKTGQKKTVTFTPRKGQTIAFACSMKMFKGKVTAK